MTAPYQMASFTFAEMAQVKREMLHHASYAERTSFALVCRLSSLRGVIADYEVLDEIAALEGGGRISNTKRDEAFKGKVLHGFRHKHFSTPRHTWRNVGDAWGLNIPADQRDQTKKFAASNDLINECNVRHRGDARSALMEAAYRFVMDGLQKRSAARDDRRLDHFCAP